MPYNKVLFKIYRLGPKLPHNTSLVPPFSRRHTDKARISVIIDRYRPALLICRTQTRFYYNAFLCNTYLWVIYYFFFRLPGITTLRDFLSPSLLFSILHDRTPCLADLQFLTLPRPAHSVQPMFLRTSPWPSRILLIFFCRVSSPHHTVYVGFLETLDFSSYTLFPVLLSYL